MKASPDPFSTPFFRAHTERRPLSIVDHRGMDRTYTFPTFFTQTPATMLLFTADHARAAAMLPDGPLRPVRISRTRCLFAVVCYRYGQISDGMSGYNEVALGIPVSTSDVPLAPALLRGVWRSFGLFVLALPVDSVENCRRGVEIWGLPKTMKSFRYDDAGANRAVEITDEEGRRCLRLSFPRGGRRTLVAEENRAYSMKGSQLLQTRAFLDGACWEYSRLSPLAAQVELELGDVAPYSDVRQLALSPRPLLVRDFESMSSVLYWPEPALTARP